MVRRAVISTAVKRIDIVVWGNNDEIIIVLDISFFSIRIAAGRETTQRRLVK